jgi:hypothetical protein
VTSRTDSFEGLHVLLVTEDEARAQAIAKSLRERKAHVGDVRAGAKDPVALRGADLLVIDARRSPAIDTRVGEVRSDVRARWASVATIDYTTLVGSEGSVDLRALEGVVSRLAGMDKALTERARKEESFETTLAPLGPTRTLRALALAGVTLHVTLKDDTLSARVDLADELLVSAFAERKDNKAEAWSALAHVIGMTDANVVVQRRAHASAMNIMEPVDQALENAAQERVKHPEQFSEEQREELSGLHAERHSEPVRAVRTSAVAPVARARTLVGVPAPRVPGASAELQSTPQAPVSSPAPAAVASSAVTSQRPLPPLSQRPSTPMGSSPFRPTPGTREPFADTPTDPAAPGLLQRMARTPANDAEVEVRKTPSEPVLSVERGGPSHSQEEEDLLNGDSSEYDTGEITVVADASQLDILRETLGRLEEQQQQEAAANEPLTSTMPAPRDKDADANELELDEALRNAAERSSPTLEQAAQLVDAAPASALRVDSASPGAPQVASSLMPAAAPSRTGKRAMILVALAVAALAAVGWLYSTQQSKPAAKPPPAAPTLGH